LTHDLQRIQIKMAVVVPPDLGLDPLVGIFARWRQDKEHPAEWVDLADYAHVPQGPGIVLIGKRGNLSLDFSGFPGILYAAKKGLGGTPVERILSALRSCLELCHRLTAEPEFPAGVEVQTGTLSIAFNDRLETPNDAATDQALRPAIQQAFDLLYGKDAWQMFPQSDPGECYGFTVKAA